MPTLRDLLTEGPQEAGWFDLEWTALGSLLVLLKLLVLAIVWAIYLSKRRRRRALEASVDRLLALSGRAAPSGEPAADGSSELAVAMARRRPARPAP